MSLSLEILAPDEVVVRTAIGGFRAADASGCFGILPGHEDFQTLLTPGLIEYRPADGGTRYAAVDGGVLLLENGRLQIATREAAIADTLDEVAAAALRMLGGRQAQEQAARAEFAELQAALLREVHVAEKEHDGGIAG